MQFQHFLAEQLGCFVRDLDRMDAVEFGRWQLYFQKKARQEKEAMDDARRGR